MLTGTRVRLVPIEQQHLDAARQWVNDPDIAEGVLRCLPVHVRDQQRWHEAAVDRADRIVFAVETLPEGRHIGTTGLYHVDWIHRRGEFWLIIGSAEDRGKGLGGEVTGLMTDYAFGSLNLRKLFVHVDPGNVAAVKTYRRAGFQDEALLQQEYYIGGRYRDVQRLCLFADDARDTSPDA